MVLYKRKPVQILALPSPPPEDDDQIWQIPQTGEIFVAYDDYSVRMDFLKSKRFNCEISGRSGLSFFEALKSEAAGGQEVEQTFPEPLKGPVLRKVQFKTTSRIDNLVDMVYDEFKDNFYPGEAVTISFSTGDRVHGVVRDKTTLVRSGAHGDTYSKYLVCVDEPGKKDHFVEADQLSRDRKAFNKSVLRSFIKKTVTREAWNGAPWLVRHNYAAQYHIDTRIPRELCYDTKLQERRLLQAQKRASLHEDANGNPVTPGTGPTRLPDLKPDGKMAKAANGAHAKDNANDVKAQNGHFSPGQFMHLPLPGNPFQAQMSIRHTQKVLALMPQPEAPPPPPPPKYPIEDLQVPPKKNATVRPKLRFLCHDAPAAVQDVEPYSEKIQMHSVGPLLETWDMLNVYCEIFKLDSFTFDDYVEAMCFACADTPIELFDEIHCSLLKVLVDENSKLQVSLPALDESDPEDEGQEEEVEEELAREPTPELKPKRATRSSMAKQEAERIAAEAAAADAEAKIVHRASEVLSGYDWVQEAGKRNFENGGWQMMVTGLVYRLAKNERKRAACDEILSSIVPRSMADPTADKVRELYGELDVNLRVQVLQMMCMLTYETRAIRAYMDDCAETMTQYRKDKIEWQRQRKQAAEDLKTLHDQKREMDAENNPSASVNGATAAAAAAPAEEDAKMPDPDETMEDDDLDPDRTDTDEDAGSRRPRRRVQEKITERSRKEKEEQLRKEKAEAVAAAAAATAAAAKGAKQSKQYLKLLKEIAKHEEISKKCEEEVATIDNDLREADCPRTRMLGRDRFWNRYYWFERNGMPYGGLPTSSTAGADYANGCIWIQGPDELERQGFIDCPASMQDEYRSQFGMTIPDRKREEEGGTSISTATQWGFVSEPEQFEDLLKWLDHRGHNELKLKKELGNFKGKIMGNMRNRRAYLDGVKAQEDELGAEKTMAKRVGTRARNRTATATPEPSRLKFRCLAWHNTMAVEEFGYIHSEQPPPPPPSKKKGKKREAVGEAEPAPARKTRKK